MDIDTRLPYALQMHYDEVMQVDRKWKWDCKANGGLASVSMIWLLNMPLMWGIQYIACTHIDIYLEGSS